MDTNLLVMIKVFKLLLTSFLLVVGTPMFSQIPCNRKPSIPVVYGQLEKDKQLLGISMSPMNYSIDCNINDSIKAKMLYLLNWKWTVNEINNYLMSIEKDYPSIMTVSQKASSIAKGDNEIFIDAFDSILRKNYISVYEIFKSLYRVNNGLILTVAFLDFKEAIPILQTSVNDSSHYNISIVKLALAKLGDKSMQKEIVENTIYDSLINGRYWNEEFEKKGLPLIFLATQESIYKTSEWLDTSKMYAARSDGKVNTKNAANVIFYLSNIILNNDFQKIVSPIKKFWGEDFEVVDNRMILNVRKWLKENMGKYCISKSYSPY